MAITIRGRVGSRQYPALYRFIGPLDLRSFHGRSMLCLLVEKALHLTEEDKQRYGSIFMSLTHAKDESQATIRRFALSISEEDHPATVAKVTEYGVERVEHPLFQHLLEVAAGLLMAESANVLLRPAPAGVPTITAPAQPESPPLPPVSVEPVASIKHKQNSAAVGVIESKADHGELAQIPAGDLDALFGVG